MLAHVVGGAHEHDFTVSEHDDPLRDVERVGGVLFDEHDAHTLVGRGPHRVQQATHNERRETEGELVDEEQLRLGCESRGPA